MPPYGFSVVVQTSLFLRFMFDIFLVFFCSGLPDAPSVCIRKQARVHRAGQWGGWADCVNNGVVVAYLGGECIDADLLEVRAASGETTTYSIDVGSAKATAARAKRAVAKAND